MNASVTRSAAPSVHPLAAAATFERAGSFVLRYSLVFLLLFFGGLKWTDAEARAVEPLIGHSPLLAWMLAAFGVRGASEAIGVIELATGIMIAIRPWAPRVAAVGGILGVVTFLITLSFLVTTPMVGEAAPFILKDVTLLGAALWSAGEALKEAQFA
jgi:uncharacterized membrane protein YkgB